MNVHQDHEFLTTENDLWTVLVAEASDVVAREPILDGIVSPLFESEETVSGILAVHLSNTLQAPGLPKQSLRNAFHEILESDPDIENSLSLDLRAVRERDPACSTHLHGLLNFKGFQALAAYRFAHRLLHDGRNEFATWLANRVSLVLGPDIHPAARIGPGVMFDHGSGIVVGETAVIGNDVSIMQNVMLGGTGNVHGDRHPKVRDGVLIGAGAKVIGNIEIGTNSKIAAGSVVLKSVPAGCTVAGVPAQIVRIHNSVNVPATSMDQKF